MRGSRRQLLALQQAAGNRAVGRVLSRRPKRQAADVEAQLAAAPDPLDYDAFPDLWWWGVGPWLDTAPDEQQIRRILVDAGVVNAKVLADSTATFVKRDRYYSFRHPKRGVVVRALVGRRLAVSTTTTGGPATRHPLGVFVYGRQPSGGGGEALGAGESGSTEDMLKLVPPEIRSALGGDKRFEKLKNADPEGLLRIAEKLASLTADELKLWRGLDYYLTDDVALMEQSVDAFLKYRERVRPGTGKNLGEAKPGKPKAAEDDSLEGRLKQTWKGFDGKRWRGMSHRDRERTARDIRWKQTKTRLKHMVTNPGETAKDMAKGIVRVDELGKGVWKDVKEAANGDNNAYRRWAGGTGAVAKLSGWVGAVAGILFLALLLIPGVNVAALATTALIAGATAVIMSEIESELRLRSAVEEDDPEKARQDIEASSAAHANFFLGAAAMAFGFALKIIAKTPIPGRLKTVGGALKAARSEIARVTRVGPAFEAVRSKLLAKLRSARSDMPGLLKGQGDDAAQLAAKIEAMEPQEFVDRLARKDPALADLEGTDASGQSVADLAQHIKDLSATGAGMDLPAKFKAQVVDGLKGASGEAAKEVARYAADVDGTIAAVEKAADPAQLRQALDAAEGKLAPEAVSAEADARVRRIAEELADREDAARQRQADVVERAKDQPKQPTESAPQSTATQQLERTLADLRARRKELVEGSGTRDRRVKSRAELQADELKARKAAAAKQRQLGATKDADRREQLQKELDDLTEKHADAEAEVLNRQEAIDKVDLEIKKAQHPLPRSDLDKNVSGSKADPPRDLPGRRIGGTPNQEAQLWSDVEWAVKQGADDIRINEFQVDIDGRVQGINRPDLQYTLNGKRYYLEYEQPSNPRGRAHAQRTIANDPRGVVVVKLVPTTPGFKPGQGVKRLTYTLDDIVGNAP